MANETEITTVSLIDFANARENVVLFWAGVGCPGGMHNVLGHADFTWAEEQGLLDLEGTVDEGGTWRWNGEGEVFDERANTIYKVDAYVDQPKWAELVEESETGE